MKLLAEISQILIYRIGR